ncbi:hypothetical protein JM93_01369 [Roseibium hamelinense]|uniref:DUF6468 domain-containing protein n=1 Tax=Roseibium hamelinense TaxID=150831 RepID=A0A562TAW7_9HYPH|nr:DUF6468 domain-containing protein [Roseibium hamelinense]MTI45248.1 chemotaxis protein [Roseibium hamelinense]TWI90388.1 hypothetical protein JM93_01369 [Roseibium hamelinense]
MSTLPIGMIIEALVAVLLVVTIGYCWMLNNRLQRLRSDEQTLRATISELMTATEIAERAILGLKTTANDADQTLGNRLQQAELMSRQLTGQVEEGEKIFMRISQIADAARGAQSAQQPAANPMEDAGYRPAPHVAAPPVQAPPQQPEPPRAKSARAQDIRSAAAEATARLERFRRRSEGAVA